MSKFWKRRDTSSGRRRRANGPAALEVLERRLLLTFDPSGLEQETLEHINRIRVNPQGELDVLLSSHPSPLTARDPDVQDALNFFNVSGSVLEAQFAALTAAQPLAWNEALYNGAQTHNNLMLVNDEQSHDFPGEPDGLQRLVDAGYNWTGSVGVGENVFAFSKSALYGHAAFVIDWGGSAATGGIQSPPGHRDNIMDQGFQEIGIAIALDSDPSTQVGPQLVTHEFGRRGNYGNPALVGVVFDDVNDDGLYNAGEGLGGVTVTVTGSNGTFTTSSMTAGGYQLKLPAGDYTVTASGGALPRSLSRSLTVGGSNEKIDFLLDSSAPTEPIHVSLPGGGGVFEVLDDVGQLVVRRQGGGEVAREAVGQRSLTITGTAAQESVRLLLNSDGALPVTDITVTGNGGNDAVLFVNPRVSTTAVSDSIGSVVVSLRTDGVTFPVTTDAAVVDLAESSSSSLTVGLGSSADTIRIEQSGVTGEIMRFSGLGGGSRTLLADEPAQPVTVNGGDGNDVIDAFGLALAILLSGDAGADVLIGGMRGDTLDGGDGDDTLIGFGGDDRLSGDNGRDMLRGSLGNDTLIGGFGRDTLIGASGSDLLTGDGGDDVLRAREGSGDLLTGGSGADTLDGGSGDDTLVEDFGSTIRLRSLTLTINSVTDRVLSIESARIAASNMQAASIDTTGFRGTTVLIGTSFADMLIGGDGNDSISGGGGNDTLTGGPGSDTLAGESGADEIHSDGLDTVINDGLDTVILS